MWAIWRLEKSSNLLKVLNGRKLEPESRFIWLQIRVPYVFISLGYKPRSTTAGSRGNSVRKHPYVVIFINYIFIQCMPINTYLVIFLWICLLNHIAKKMRSYNQKHNNTCFYIYLCGYLYQLSIFLCMASSYTLVFFCFSLKDSV